MPLLLGLYKAVIRTDEGGGLAGRGGCCGGGDAVCAACGSDDGGEGVLVGGSVMDVT